MTIRAWFRALILLLAIIVVWMLLYAAVSHRNAVYVEAEKRARAEHALMERMIEAGRSIEEIQAALERLKERYKVEHEES